jgi:flavin reductase (DIM6/NTAB) family NADH-FMN oxidoreductase RutF
MINMDVNSSLFKRCMGKFATGITIVTTLAPGGKKMGVTVNSFNSVSLEPSLILFSLKKKSHFYSYFDECRYCTVNILSEKQRHLSAMFTKTVDEDWRQVKTVSDTMTDSPAIADTLAFLECEVFAKYDGGDHTIFVCKVVNLVEQSNDNPLVYFSSEYRVLDNKKL